MTEYEREIQRLRREFFNQSEANLERFREQLARQEVEAWKHAVEAIKRNDPATALNALLKAELLSELRRRG